MASESALAAGLVMGIMIIPLVSSLSDDAINAVPSAMRDGALGLGLADRRRLHIFLITQFAQLPRPAFQVLNAFMKKIEFSRASRTGISLRSC